MTLMTRNEPNDWRHNSALPRTSRVLISNLHVGLNESEIISILCLINNNTARIAFKSVQKAQQKVLRISVIPAEARRRFLIDTPNLSVRLSLDWSRAFLPPWLFVASFSASKITRFVDLKWQLSFCMHAIRVENASSNSFFGPFNKSARPTPSSTRDTSSIGNVFCVFIRSLPFADLLLSQGIMPRKSRPIKADAISI